MAKYNKTKTGPAPVVNHQGGTAMAYKPEYELIALLSTGMNNNFYEKENDREKRLAELIKIVGEKNPVFLAKALVYTRSVIGQRSVTHVGAALAAPILSGTEIGRKFYGKRDKKKNKGGIVHRIDDILEIVAYYFLRNKPKAGKKHAALSNAMKAGFKQALENADTYELAKYQAKRNSVSLVDICNLVSPKPSEKMMETFKLLMSGDLKQFNTAEDKNSEAGQVVAAKVKSGEITKEEAKTELAEAKAENWKELITNGTLGYLALLRNLRNITNTATDEVFKLALNMLVDEKRVRESLVFPHQIDLAFEVLLLEGLEKSGRKTELLTAVNKAYEMAIPNLKELFAYGKTAVVVDTSGSMTSQKVAINQKASSSRPIDKAALVAATLVKGTDCDLYQFAESCSSISINPLDTVNTIKNRIISLAYGGGTAFTSIFNALKDGYTRVIIVSDMQGGDSVLTSSAYKNYMNRNAQPYVYSIDMCGYGTTMFKDNQKYIKLFGYSKDIYEFVRQAEIDPEAIIKEINKIVI